MTSAIPIKLLIVDDDQTLCANLKSFFERYNYKIHVVHDGVSALSAVESFQPDVVFLDIGLPGMPGIDVLREIKNKSSGIRVIMITGMAEEELQREARILGADEYVIKPFTLEYLKGTVMDKLHRLVLRDYHALSENVGLEREKFDRLFDAMPDGVLLLDRQGMVVRGNPKAGNLLEISFEQHPLRIIDALKNYHFQPQRASPQSALPLPEPISFELIKKQGQQRFDLVRPSPRSITLECCLTSVSGGKENLKGHLLFLRDVSEQRRESFGMKRLIDVVSHKFRTPLTSMGYIFMLKDPGRMKERLKKRAWDNVISNYERLSAALDGLAEFGTLHNQKIIPEPIALRTLIEAGLGMFRGRKDVKPGKVKWNPADFEIAVMADPVRMPVVFYHLFHNAFKFKATRVNLTFQPHGNYVSVEIADNGIGIPAASIDRIFEWFYQVDDEFTGQQHGMGLGLSVVQSIVEAHDGRVSAKSRFKKGSTFTVSLPAAKPSQR
jgi:signal transduction histidine kinase